MQKQMDNISREMKILRRNKNAKNKKYYNRMNTIFDRLIIRLNIAEEGISKLEDMTIETSKLKRKKGGKKTEI